jgi:hypothetical protein
MHEVPSNIEKLSLISVGVYAAFAFIDLKNGTSILCFYAALFTLNLIAIKIINKAILLLNI